jgi:hypothetical protein
MSLAPESCGRFHSLKFNVERPPVTSLYASHEKGATFVYHFQVVSFEWQSKQALLRELPRPRRVPLRLRLHRRILMIAAVGDRLGECEQHDSGDQNPDPHDRRGELPRPRGQKIQAQW